MNDRRKKVSYLFFAVFLFVYVFIVLRNGWLCDDAYISLRTVDNFVNGFGLTWNVAERVQAFTHPLWILLIIPLYALTHEVYFTVMIISLALSLAAVAWFAFRLSTSSWSTIAGLLALSLSTAFVDFSTSGLENPLTFALLALFCYYYFKDPGNKRTLLHLSLIASLGAVNRLDTLLLFAPMLLHAFWQIRGRKAVITVIIGFMPLIVWEIFSLVYYGFPFPNTAYAKLNTGLDRIDVWQQGIQYIIYSLRTDPITVVIILSGIIIPFFTRQRKLIMPAVAVLLYTLYIVNIGGCFMAGRYLAAPLLLAVILLAQYRHAPTTVKVLWIGFIIVAGLTAPDSSVYAGRNDKGEPSKISHGVVRERDWYNPTHGLMNVIAAGDEPSHHWIDEGRQARRDGLTYIPHVAVGMVGFYAGPKAFILDVYAITDPLLARLPMNKHLSYRIGHFGRIVPAGYKRTIMTDENHIGDPYLHEYYDKLVLLTRGPIFSLTRFKEIAKFNLGWYDHLVDQYLSPHLIQVTLEDISEPRQEGIIGVFANNLVFYRQGLEIDLGDIRHAPRFELARDHNNGQRLQFLLAGEEIASGIIPAAPVPPGGLSRIIVSVPPDAVSRGYDQIRIIPSGEANQYQSIAYLRLTD